MVWLGPYAQQGVYHYYYQPLWHASEKIANREMNLCLFKEHLCEMHISYFNQNLNTVDNDFWES